MIKAGELDQRILIETPATAVDALGQDARSWTYLAEPWAAVRYPKNPGREFLQGEYRAERIVMFVIRWRELNSAMRVTWKGVPYRIESVSGTRHAGEVWLHCVTVEGFGA